MEKCSIAPGKVLLFGEHFVVKGKPALGLAVTMYANVCVRPGTGKVYSKQLGLVEEGSIHWRLIGALLRSVKDGYGEVPPVDVEIDSQIPIAAGMGSSASVAVALAHALLSYIGVDFTREDVWKIAHEAEKAVHYQPSGVDTTLATHGGLLYYKQGVFRKLDLKLPENAAILVVNTRVKRSTGQVVREVLERCERLGNAGRLIYDAAGEIVEKAIDLLRAGDMRSLGELMLVNHGLLWAMGASAEICDKAVYELVKNGAYGGKVSGAGRGGVVIGVIDVEKARSVEGALHNAGFECFTVKPDYTGVRACN